MSTIKSLDLTTALNNAVTDVFATMLSMEIVPVADPPQPESVEDRLVGTVTFAGEITGIVSIDVSHRFCRLMAASMMEMAPEEIEDDEETKDLLGEVSNIIGGNLKSAFTDEGLSCAISTPAITQGQDFQVQSLNMEIYEQLAYAYGDHLFRLELGVKVQEKSMAGDLEKLDSGPTLTLDEVFSALNLTAKIEESVIDVFDTMLSIELEKIETRPQEQRGGERLVGAITFAGSVLGIISVDVSQEFARIMTASMMGGEPEEVEDDEEIKDLLGELSNIIGGNLKSQFSDKGMVCAISTPSITSGADFVIESLSMETYHQFGFKAGENEVYVELGLKSTHGINVFASASNNEAPEAVGIENGQVTDPSALVAAVAAQQEAAAAVEQASVAKGNLGKTPRVDPQRLKFILDIPIRISVELGRTRVTIDEVVSLDSGSVIELVKMEREPVDILANNQLIAKGEVMVQDGKYGIRILEIVSHRQRLLGLT